MRYDDDLAVGAEADGHAAEFAEVERASLDVRFAWASDEDLDWLWEINDGKRIGCGWWAHDDTEAADRWPGLDGLIYRNDDGAFTAALITGERYCEGFKTLTAAAAYFDAYVDLAAICAYDRAAYGKMRPREMDCVPETVKSAPHVPGRRSRTWRSTT